MKTFSLGLVSISLLLAAPGFAVAQQPQGPTSVPATQASPGMPDVIGAWPDSQSYPAKYSKRNDALDKLPVMGHPVPLTDAQKKLIVEAVKQQNKPAETIAAAPAQILPSWVHVEPVPPSLTTDVPILDHLGYVRVPNKILLVAPANKIVVGEVAE